MKRIVPLLVLAVCIPATALATTSSGTTATTKKSSTTSTTTTTKTTRTHTAAKTHATKETHSEPATHSSLGLNAVGLGVGFVSPENINGTFMIGGFADCGRITPRIALEPRLDYWSHSEEDFGSKASVRDVIFGVRGKYMFEVANPKLQPFAGVGVGLHFLHAEATTPASGGFPPMTVEDSSTKLGLDFGGGMSMPMGPRTDLLGELWYGVVSDVSQFSMRIGMAYRIGM